MIANSPSDARHFKRTPHMRAALWSAAAAAAAFVSHVGGESPHGMMLFAKRHGKRQLRLPHSKALRAETISAKRSAARFSNEAPE